MSENQEDVLTVEEAAAYLGVKVNTFWKYAKRYNIPRYKKPLAGKKVFFRKADLDALKVARPAEAERKAS